MEPQYQQLSEGDRSDKIHTTHDLIEMIAGFLKSYLFGNSFDLWTKNGVRCNLLKVGSPGWTQGRIRVSLVLEFAPGEPSKET